MHNVPIEYLPQTGDVTPDGRKKTLFGIRGKPEFPVTPAPNPSVDTGVADSHVE
jgi:hypothetical protein